MAGSGIDESLGSAQEQPATAALGLLLVYICGQSVTKVGVLSLSSAIPIAPPPEHPTISIGGGTVRPPRGLYFAVTEGGEIADVGRLSFMEGPPVTKDREEEQVAMEDEDSTSGGKEGKEEEEMVWNEQSKRIVLKLGHSRAIIKLYGGAIWELTKAYQIEWLDRNDKDLVFNLMKNSSEDVWSTCKSQESSWCKEQFCMMDFEGCLMRYTDSMGLSPHHYQFEPMKKLGQGGGGLVYGCGHMFGNCALKIINLSKCRETDEPREVKLMSSLDNANIVQFFQAWTESKSNRTGIVKGSSGLMWDSIGIHPKAVFIHMELCARTLRDVLSNGNYHLSLHTKWLIIKKISEGVKYLLDNGIVHRDVKPANILIGHDNTIKIADFDHACWLESYADGKTCTPDRGTVVYRPPELIRNYVNDKVDVYSIGIIMFEIIPKFEDLLECSIALYAFFEKKYKAEWGVHLELIKAATADSPSDRLSVEDILEYVEIELQKTGLESTSLNIIHDALVANQHVRVGKKVEEPPYWADQQVSKRTISHMLCEICFTIDDHSTSNCPHKDSGLQIRLSEATAWIEKLHEGNKVGFFLHCEICDTRGEHSTSKCPHQELAPLTEDSAHMLVTVGSLALQDGADGKGTWGKLIDTDVDACLDRNDSNYDSGEEPCELVEAPVSIPLDDYKKAVVPIIEEYFSNGDVKLAASDLKELGYYDFHNYFVKKLVSTAMDRHDKEKEMASVLLSSLHGNVISSTQIRLGFVLLLDAVDDLVVDIDDAVDILALFIARAIVDDILPPAFLSKAKVSLSESSKGMQVVQIAEKSYLSTPHHAELIEWKWGGSTQITVEEVKKRITDLLKEYIKNGDTSKACRCIRESALSFFHHEVVKRALTLGMESPDAENLITKLLKEASEEFLISSSQMMKGFSSFAESLDDLSLDVPSAKSRKSEFQLLASKAISEGWLDSSYGCSDVNGDAEDDEHEKLARYKREAVSIIHEYFLSDDTAEVIRSLKELGYLEYNPIFVKKLITIALDRKNSEKEMASVLLSSLSMELFSTEDIVKGFIMLLKSAEDTALDILDASDELGLFLARAVIDDVLAPLNLDEISSKLPPDCSGVEILNTARSLASTRHAGKRLLRCWVDGTGWIVEDVKDKITKFLEEYESGGDVGEAFNCIRGLVMSFFNHEVVKKVLVMAMERKHERILDLLQECFGEGIITINQMTKGFSRVRDGLDDLALDIPDAREKFLTYVEHAKKSGWLLPSFNVASSTRTTGQRE